MRFLVRFLGVLFVGATSFASQAQDIVPSCMVTFNVKNKGFINGNATMSCQLVEARRVEMSQQILATQGTGEIDGAVVGKKLDLLEADIKKQQDTKNWLSLGNAITGNTLATIGLGACLESGGAGCALAVVGKFMALYSIYDAASSENDKVQQANAMRTAISDVRKSVVGKKSQAKTIRDRMIEDANALCKAVKDNCL